MNLSRYTRISGFTIVEMVVCLAILAVLATAALPLAELSVQRAKEAELRRALWEIRDALDAYKRAADDGWIPKAAEDSGFPSDLETLVEGVPDLRSPTSSRMMYFLREVPRDPFYADASAPAADTWALRSYDSTTDHPEPGNDVYDVRSTSREIGTNGIPYSAW